MIKDSYLMVDALAQRNNVFTRMDPRLKVIGSLVALGIVIGIPGFRLSLAVFALAAAGLLSIRTPLKLLAPRLLPPLMLGLTVLTLMVFFRGGQEAFTIQLGSFRLVGYTAGFSAGLTVLSRLMACVSVMMLLALTTPLQELGYALIWCRVPKVIVEILLLTYRYIFVLWDEGVRIREAQTMRLGYPGRTNLTGWRTTLTSTVTLMAMVFIRAYDRSESTFSAMQVRAYNGNMATYGYKSWSRIQTKYLMTGVIIVFVVIAVSF